jgi:outer membrane protein insertion porin family
MGYFSKVEAASVGADALDEKDVVFNVEEKEDKYYLRIGAGASDNNNVFGMAEISTNNFDITNPKDWFYGGGQRFRLQGIIGMENAGFNVDFVEPWLLDMPLRLEVSAFMNETYYENWDEDHVGARFSLSRRFFDDFTSVTAGYKIENVRVHNIDRKLKNYMRENGDSGSHVVSQPSILIARDTRNSLLTPTSGYNVSLFASVTPEFLGSSDSYYRLEAKGSFYYSFWDEAIVTMIGGKIGTVSGFHSNDDIPVFERYFMGGTGSLRGFEYRTVSPTYDDENIGGQSMILMTAEISHPIWGPLRGFAFVDVGTVGSNAYSIPLHNLNMGAGYGIRIKIPQLNAPLELALAYPIVNNQDSEKSRLRIHFNVGMGLAF